MNSNIQKEETKKQWKMKDIPSVDFINHLSGDVMKSSLTQSIYMMQMIGKYPVKRNAWVKFYQIIFHVNYIIFYILHAFYFSMNLTSLEVLATAMPAFCSITQSLSKGAGFMLSRRGLNKAFYILWKDFWPSSFLNEREHEDVELASRVAKTFTRTFPFLSLSVTMLMVAPSIYFGLTERKFGIELLLTPKFKYRTPYYEILAVWECIMFPYGIWHCLAYDFMFISVVNNVATQFRLLRHAIARICTKDPLIPDNYKGGTSEKELLVLYINHHYLLLQYCTEIDGIFTFVAFSQFFVSVLGICISAVLYSVYPDKGSIMIAYCWIYILQLFMYCYPGNELKYYSEQLSDGFALSNWYDSFDNSFKKALIPMMVRAQREISISVGYFFQLDLRNYINVIKMSFSFYTLLSKVLAKKTIGTIQE